MKLKQCAEEFAKEFLDTGGDIDPDELECCQMVYMMAAKQWAEKGFDAAVNSRMSFKEWWKEVGGE